MKKNRMMRLASGLLVAVLITTSTISGTFAKYTTSGTATDSARVAKFGVTVTGETAATNEMFVNEYKNGADITVQSTVDVVAPGTSGTMTAFDIAGVPEVDVVVKYENVALTLENWTTTGTDFYCPLVFKVTNNTATPVVTTVDGKNYPDDKAGFVAAVKAAVESVSLVYDVEAASDLANAENDLTINWEWVFEGDNAKDTIIGNAAAGIAADGTAMAPRIATVQLDVTCRVDQLD